MEKEKLVLRAARASARLPRKNKGIKTAANEPSGAPDTALSATRHGKRAKIADVASKVAFIACACISILAILSITLYLVIQGVPGIAKVGLFRFLFGTTWQPTNESIPLRERFGILPMIWGSVTVAAGAIIIGGVIGVFAAVFIARFCPRKMRGVVRQIINLLAGLPSVIYGFFGLVVLVPALRDLAKGIGIGNFVTGSGIAASSLVLAIMILPIITALVVNALEAQPAGYYEGALALGATKGQAVFKVLVPASKSGILTGVVLGIGRALGETMAVVMVCGGKAGFPDSIFHSMRTLTANVVMEMGYAQPFHMSMLISSALVLFVFVMLLTLSVSLLRRNKK